MVHSVMVWIWKESKTTRPDMGSSGDTQTTKIGGHPQTFHGDLHGRVIFLGFNVYVTIQYIPVPWSVWGIGLLLGGTRMMRKKDMRNVDGR